MEGANCNLTVGYYSAPPAFTMEETENGIVSSIPRLTKEMNMLSRVRSMRILYKNVGDITRTNYIKMVDDGEIEAILLPYRSDEQGLEREPMPILFENGLVIVTLLDEIPQKYADITESMSILEPRVLILILLFFMSISILATLRGKKSILLLLKTMWSLFTTSLKQSPLNSQVALPRRVIVGFVLFLALLSAFFEANFNTRLVASDNQFIINTLNDLTDPRATKYCPVWRKNDGGHLDFSYSKNEIKKLIWFKAILCGERSFIADGPQAIIQLLNNYNNHPWVAFVNEFVMRSLHAGFCQSNLFESAGKKLHYGKETIVKYLTSFVFKSRNDSCVDFKRKMIKFYFQGAFEGSIGKNFFLDSAYLMYIDKPFENWKCLGWKDELTNAAHEPVKLVNVKKLLILFFSLIAFSFFILAAEIIFSFGFR